MAARPLYLVSNIQRLEKFAPPDLIVQHQIIPPDAGARAAFRLFARSFRSDVILLDGNPAYLGLLCLLRWLWPFGTCRLVSIDILFVKPVTRMQRLRAWVWKQLLRRVDHFLHYFKDLEGYRRYFGIGWERSTYVPFKVNGWDKLVPPAAELSSDGTYVFTGGRSLRDLDTFLAAMRQVPYPAILLYHDRNKVAINGTALPLNSLPPNVQAVEDDGSLQSWLSHLRGARIVVVTPLASSIRAIGISTYLNAMALRKCVVITDSPATNGILEHEAILVPPADPTALAAAIRNAWENDGLRETTAAAGRAYAEQLGGEARLLSDVLRVCAELCSQNRATAR